jgi:hypothetical protein
LDYCGIKFRGCQSFLRLPAFCFFPASAKHGARVRRRPPTLARTVFLAHYFSMLTDEQTSPEQFAIYRRMTPERRLALAEQLCWTAREMKMAWLRSQHADWPEEKVRRDVAQIFSHART